MAAVQQLHHHLNPLSGLFTQYVHLVYKGSLVKMGDAVKSGQPIALSGITGQTNIAHLHLQLPGSLPQPGRLEISTGPVYRRLRGYGAESR